MTDYKYKDYASNFVHYGTEILNLPIGDVWHSFYKLLEDPTDVRISILDFNREISKQWVSARAFEALVDVNAHSSTDTVWHTLEANEFSIGASLVFHIIPNKAKKNSRITILNEYYSDSNTGSFNPGQKVQYGTKNAGCLVEAVSDSEYILKFNSGVHEIEEEPKFLDLICKVEFAPYKTLDFSAPKPGY
jgi:hypothetical protein